MSEKQDQAIRRITRVAQLLDSRFEIPGTGIQFGLDAIIGLIPGIGDILTTLLSLGILLEATRMGAPGSLLVRMLANILVDAVLGAIPVAGDVADVFYRANLRNSKLVIEWVEHPARVRSRSRILALLVGGALCLLILAALASATLIALWLARSIVHFKI